MTIGVSSPGNLYFESSSRTSSSTSSKSSLSSTMSALLRKTTIAGTPTWRAKQDMLTSLRHRPVSCGNDQNRAVHLRCTGDHVLDVVGMARAVDMSVMTFISLVFDVSDIDRDAALSFFWRFIDLIVGKKLAPCPLFENFGDRRSQSRFAMIDVTDRADVQVWFFALKFLSCSSHPPMIYQSISSNVSKFARSNHSSNKPRSGIEPLTSSLPRTCSTD